MTHTAPATVTPILVRLRSGAQGRIIAVSPNDRRRVLVQRWMPGLGWLHGSWYDVEAVTFVETVAEAQAEAA